MRTAAVGGDEEESPLTHQNGLPRLPAMLKLSMRSWHQPCRDKSRGAALCAWRGFVGVIPRHFGKRPEASRSHPRGFFDARHEGAQTPCKPEGPAPDASGR